MSLETEVAKVDARIAEGRSFFVKYEVAIIVGAVAAVAFAMYAVVH